MGPWRFFTPKVFAAFDRHAANTLMKQSKNMALFEAVGGVLEESAVARRGQKGDTTL